jgi:Mrp family chromosome partitioning ATPase
MEPIDYVGALRRSWRLLVALAIVGAIVAILVPVGHTKKKPLALPYEAVAIVGSAPGGASNAVAGGVSAGQIQFYASLTTTQQQAATIAHLHVVPFVLYQYMTAQIGTVNPGVPGTTTTLKGKKNASSLVSLIGRGKTALDAVNLANIYAFVVKRVLQDQANAHAQAIAAANPNSTGPPPSASTGYFIQSQSVEGFRIKNHTASLGASRKVRLGGGLVLGLAVGAAIVLLRELLDKRLRNASRAEANFGYPVIVEIPTPQVAGKSARDAAPAVDVVREPLSPGAEAYRMLRMSVLFESLAADAAPAEPFGYGYENYANGNGRAAPSAPRNVPSVETLPAAVSGRREVVLVASAGVEPSRPHVAANLAAIYAEAGQRVIVISTGDIETGRRTTGAGAHVTGEIRSEDVAQCLESSRLEHVYRLPLSPFIATSGQLVTRGPSVLEAARGLSDVVIVEVPPILAVHHAEALARSVDVVLVVGECGWTTFQDARTAGDLLRRMEAPVLGVVLTNVRLKQRDIRTQVPYSPAGDASSGGTDEAPALGTGLQPEPASTPPAPG